MSKRAWLAIAIIVSMVAGVLLAAPISQTASAQATQFILNVGVQDETKNRNLIRVTYITSDVWTSDVLSPVLDGTVQVHYDTQELLPYVMVGTDQDGDRALDANEIGVFDPVDGTGVGTGARWVAFYDIRGLRFHDATDVTMEDVLMGYHLKALAPAIPSSRFVKDLGGQTGTNYTADRWLAIRPVTVTGWYNGPIVDSARQFAFNFTQTGPNAQFNRDTLQATILQRSFWEGTGGGRHQDFGTVLCPATMNGVPANGACGGQTLKPFNILAASGDAAVSGVTFEALDGDVIGTGPFKFDTWVPGSIARVVKNPDYFLGADPFVVAKTLAAGLRVPALDAMLYRLYRNVQAGIFALRSGEVDFLDWFVPPAFVGSLRGDPNVGLKTSADAGYFYMGYNLRRLPMGYLNPSQGSAFPWTNDVGRPFRLAVSHAIDKRTIVTSLLQNFGVPGHTVVSPTNTLYYNESAGRYEFDMALAKSILDSPTAVTYGYGADPQGDCQLSGAGCRSLPGKGTQKIDILTPQADYDPIRANAGTLIATSLRQLGLNVVSAPTAFGQIVTRVFDQQDFDMWILGWSLSGFIVPSYIDSFYHSRNVDLLEDNAEGYINTTLDDVIDAAVGAASPAEAVRLWKYAQGIINNDMPTDTLYFRTNIFGFRQDRIDGDSWRFDIGGDVFTYWSWVSLDPAPPGLIRSSAAAPSAVASGGTATVTVTVRDANGDPLPGAAVSVSVTGPGSVAPASGPTSSSGEFSTVFTAPTLQAVDTPVSSFIEISATSTEFGAARDISIVITTFPPGAQFLATLVRTPFGNAVTEGGAVVLDVDITDQDGLPAADATVAITVTPATPSLGLPATSSADAAGRVTATGTAPPVVTDTTFTVTVSAVRGGVQALPTTVSLTVLNAAVVTPPSGGEVFLIAGAVIATGATGGAYYGLRRRRMKK